MTIYRLDNFYPEDTLKKLHDFIQGYENNTMTDQVELGRTKVILEGDIPISITNPIIELVHSISGKKLAMSNRIYVEYSNKIGQPNLPPHFDGDYNDFFFSYQYKSNTSWPIGIGMELYDLQDNCGVLFNANEHMHWRPHKNFKDGEYVKMIFFRFCDEFNMSDYSDKTYPPNHEIFNEINKYRDNLYQIELAKSEGEK